MVYVADLGVVGRDRLAASPSDQDTKAAGQELEVTSLVIRTQTRIATWVDDDRGASLIEYALLVAFIAVAAIFAITQIGQKTLSNTASIINEGGFDAG